jgi:ribosome biogenesis GTPase
MINLETLGWSESFAAALDTIDAKGVTPGRVIAHKSDYRVLTAEGVLRCKPSGALKYKAAGAENLPVIGDWVAVRPRPGEESGTIAACLPRKSTIQRRIPGTTTEAHVIAANVDRAFLVSGLDGELNPPRIERYLVIIRQGGVEPIIVLNKSDMCEWPDEAIAMVSSAAPGVRVVSTSAESGSGFDELEGLLGPGITAVMLGSSGVGKSSILNRLMDEERMPTAEVRETDGRGRHTTTHRELFVLPSGGMLIDTPGLREVQLWDADGGGMVSAFEDIEQLALKCRFTDCKHDTEPGCAVQNAIEEGSLDADRLDNYRKLQRELSHLREKIDIRERLTNKKRIAKLTAEQRRRLRKEDQ